MDTLVRHSPHRGEPRPTYAPLRRPRARRSAADPRDGRGGRQRAPPPARTPLETNPVQAMTRDTLAFLKRLLDTPGPSGFDTAPARVWRSEAETFADQVSTDVTGNSVAAVNPEGVPRIMFAGHIDEIGLMIVHVDDEGYLYFSLIGGWDAQVLVGQRVVIVA